jgi:hypothetical protein
LISVEFCSFAPKAMGRPDVRCRPIFIGAFRDFAGLSRAMVWQ